jgi:hypothetical protein
MAESQGVSMVRTVHSIDESPICNVLWDLLVELASELDLHYEDEDYLALGTTIYRMRSGANLTNKLGRETPPAVQQCLERPYRAQN